MPKSCRLRLKPDAGSFNYSWKLMIFFLKRILLLSLCCFCSKINKNFWVKEKTRLINTVFFLVAVSHGRMMRYSGINATNF